MSERVDLLSHGLYAAGLTAFAIGAVVHRRREREQRDDHQDREIIDVPATVE